jgi:hypothetical protein
MKTKREYIKRLYIKSNSAMESIDDDVDGEVAVVAAAAVVVVELKT